MTTVRLHRGSFCRRSPRVTLAPVIWLPVLDAPLAFGHCLAVPDELSSLAASTKHSNAVVTKYTYMYIMNIYSTQFNLKSNVSEISTYTRHVILSTNAR